MSTARKHREMIWADTLSCSLMQLYIEFSQWQIEEGQGEMVVERHEEMPVNGKQRETNKRDDLKKIKTLFKLKDFPVFI